MKWLQCNSALFALILTFFCENVLGGFQDNSSSFLTPGSPSSLFSNALKNSRLYDTSLQSSIIRLIRELMLTPKVYNLISSGTQAERRADHGRILFPGESQSQGRSSSIIFANPVRSSRQLPTPSSVHTTTPGLRAMALSSRTIDSSGGGSDAFMDNANSNDRVIVNGVPGALITRNGYRMGKVERVPRPIIINGNDAAMSAPRYNRMLEGPAPTVGGSASVKIPKPSVIMSQPLRIVEGNRDSRGRSLKEIDVQGVRVIVGQRVPDDPEDKLFTWRNGRVIKGMFFPNDPSNSRPMNQEESNDISKAPPGSFVVSSAYNF